MGQAYATIEDQLIFATDSVDEYLSIAQHRGLPLRTRAAVQKRKEKLRNAGGEATSRPFVSPEDDRFAVDDEPVIPPRLNGKPDDDDDWEELFTHLERASSKRDLMGDSTKTVEWTAPVSGPIGIAFLSDIHAGSGGVLYQQFRDDIEMVANTDGLYGIINGDLFENTKPQAKSGTALYSSVFASPKEQIKYITMRLEIARGKWVVITQGNHDAWDYKHAGIDRLPDLCRALDTPYATEAGATVTAIVGGHRYTIVVKHDYAGKSRINKSNSGRRLWDEWPHILENMNADVVALAHLHEPDLHETMKKGHPVVMLRSGSYKVRDGWAESAGFKPSYGVPIVVLDPKEKHVTPFRDFRRGVEFLQDQRRRWKG